MAGGVRKPANDEFDVPDLELKDPLAPKSSAPPPPQPPPSAPPASPYSGAMDDDLMVGGHDELMLERNVMPEPVSVSMTRQKSPGVAPPLELGHAMGEQPFAPRHHDVPKPRRLLGTIANVLIVGLGFGGAAAPLVRFVHRAAGWRLPTFFHYALDGGSTIWSGSASMATLAATILLVIMGTYARPRSSGYLLAGLGMLLVAISFIIITFSVSPAGPPEIAPDGARLVPWVVPVIPLGIGFRLLRNAWSKCDEREAASRLKGFCLAAISAATLFVSVELGFGVVFTR
jgi:hypothetical protein